MLRQLRIRGFKSLEDVRIDLPRFAVLFGPNAAGKSNLLDAVQVLSRLGTERTISEALDEPIRGYPIEAFTFPAGGLAGLLGQERATFRLEAEIGDIGTERKRLRYWIAVTIYPRSGGLSVTDEYLGVLTSRGEPKGNPSIERVDDQFQIRRKSKPGHPRQEPIGLNHSLLSDPRFVGVEYTAIESCRRELAGWRVYYLDPRSAMREAQPPWEASDIGVLGEDIAPFLYRLRAEHPERFAAVQRTVRMLVPSVEAIDVDLDPRRGYLDIIIREGGVDFSSRIVSEGTLRVIGLCACAVNPWAGSLLAFEEPENGVHPRRIELIAKLLLSLALDQNRQVIVTTHSPLFCGAVVREAHSFLESREVALLSVRRGPTGTEVRPFDATAPLFRDQEIAEALTSRSEDGVFEGLVLRGLLDG